MNKSILMPIIFGFLTVTCYFGQDGEIYSDTFHYSTKEYERLDVSFSYGLGSLTILPNSDSNAIDGTVRYNPEKMTPDVQFDSFGSTGIFKAEIQSAKDDDEFNISFKDFSFDKHIDKFENDMKFRLPTSIETELSLEFGLGSASLDLSGIRLSKLDLDCGLSDVVMKINRQNPIRTHRVIIESGLGDLNVSGLGNLKAEDIDLKIGIGSADIDFRGDDIHDMDINVEVGLGSLDITLPEKTNIRVTVSDSFLSSVDISGLVKNDQDIWESPEWRTGRPYISVDVNVGLGAVDIDIRD